MSEKRLLIEEFLPTEEISKEAKIEKLGDAKPPISNLHYWWTRKPLITARAAVLGALIDLENIPWKVNPDNYKTFEQALKANVLELLKLRGNKRAHNYDPDFKRIREGAIKTWGEIPTVLDPFAGGGSIPFEALRLGVNAVAVDYNPVAYLILKATLEYPKKYGWRLYNDVKKYSEQIIRELKEELGHLYPKHNERDVAAYIYAWVVKCPHCGFETPLVGTWQLTVDKKYQCYLDYTIKDGKLKFEIKNGIDNKGGNVYRGSGICLNCGSEIPNEKIVEDIRKNQKEKLLAVVLLEKRGKSYDLPSEEDLKALKAAEKELKKNWIRFYREGLIPDEELPEDKRAIWVKSYLSKWYMLFNPRQLLLMIKYTEKAKKIIKDIAREDEEYAKAVGVYLSAILTKHLMRNSRATTLIQKSARVAHIFTNRGISMMWDHVEVNPFVDSSGTLVNNMYDTLNGLEYAIKKLSNTLGKIEVYNESILRFNPNKKFKIIVTDPPYYDDVPYGEVSTAFYVWHRRIIGELFKGESKYFRESQIVTEEEIDIGGDRDKDLFNKLFTQAIRKLHELLEDDGILVLFFAHKSPEAWHFVLEALRNAGFKITATYPLHTEHKYNVIAQGKKSIYHSLIIVARKRKEQRAAYLEDLMEEIERRVIERAKKFEKYGLKGSDLLVASMGVVLEVLTQYSELKSYSGTLSTLDAIELAQKILAKYAAMKATGLDNVDPTTTFYLYLRLNGMDKIGYSIANQLIKSLGVNEKLLEQKKLIKFVQDKTKKLVLQDFYRGDLELEIQGKDPLEGEALIDHVHRAMRAYVREGLKGFNKVLDNAPYPREAIIGVLKALANIGKDPQRENDREAKLAGEILRHVEKLSVNRPITEWLQAGGVNHRNI